ncbi:helix-turn-helix domain-containing protein [Paenibacillus larvae]|uniref:helix-turn-helix domain-containing protein n=1 Tax=Paenibacillus larvae TaxID=1464 RepID=UPI00288D8ECC|nr:helix-turn-helix domain-containing protein [Paenibacillus larvae]MDT2192843.1 helix-turn-helix domain-containing protein [Paenibacillus larvae]
MSKRSPTSLEVKLRVVKRCLQNETNPSYEAKQLGIDKNTVTDWVRKYKADGLDGLKESEDVKLTQRICNWLQSSLIIR